MAGPSQRAFADFLARVHETSDAIDRRDAAAWAVVCLDLEEPVSVVYVTAEFDSPEEALVEAGKQEAENRVMRERFPDDEAGWSFSVVPVHRPGRS